jgi:hypothetical protein
MVPMRVATDNWQFEVDDSWLSEVDFNPEIIAERHYKADPTKSNGKEIFVVNISDINPTIRGDGIPIFNDGEVDGKFLTAKKRTVSILKAIMTKSALPPIEVVDSQVPKYKYKLVHGSHRLHCSIAAGFTEIPAIYGFDITDF